ncbi:hypothetical protein ILUMI_09934 [Ignelater luminosus]|uniref:Uncharacterized protein n=1 Tax=Ignelater luminosus TaxID=2038154 RepID=A0A8K0CYU7_IGNLU|nr:hypothetical protein ILUMI_09934 [Ignelater luminosus]
MSRPTDIPYAEEVEIAKCVKTMKKWSFGFSKKELDDTPNQKKTQSDVPSTFIWNSDETSFCLNPSRIEGVGEKCIAAHKTSSDPGKNNMTVLKEGNAAKKKLPPLIVFKGKHAWNSWIPAKQEDTVVAKVNFDPAAYQTWCTHQAKEPAACDVHSTSNQTAEPAPYTLSYASEEADSLQQICGEAEVITSLDAVAQFKENEARIKNKKQVKNCRKTNSDDENLEQLLNESDENEPEEDLREMTEEQDFMKIISSDVVVTSSPYKAELPESQKPKASDFQVFTVLSNNIFPVPKRTEKPGPSSKRKEKTNIVTSSPYKAGLLKSQQSKAKRALFATSKSASDFQVFTVLPNIFPVPKRTEKPGLSSKRKAKANIVTSSSYKAELLESQQPKTKKALLEKSKKAANPSDSNRSEKGLN